jgi:hypothetical protein
MSLQRRKKPDRSWVCVHCASEASDGESQLTAESFVKLLMVYSHFLYQLTLVPNTLLKNFSAFVKGYSLSGSTLPFPIAK